MSEDIDRLNQAVRDLNQTLQTLTGNVGNLSESTAKATINTNGLTEVEKARLEAQKKLHEHDLQLKDAAKKAGDAVGNFAKGILDTNVKLTNLNDGLSSAGDAAFALGKAFGPLGMVIGGLVKGFTMLLEANLKISQAYLEGKDQLNKLGAAGSHTTKELQGMARDAGLNAETLGRMIKPLQSMGMGIMSLGATAGEGQKAFAKLIKTTDEERARMSRLGIDQEQMMQGQADYLALQAASGRNLKAESVDREKLRKSSLEYQTNLMELSALTGKDAQTLKDRQKDMLTNRQVQLKNLQDQVKERRLREEAAKETDAGRKAELEARADALKNELANRQQAFEALAGAPEVLRKGIQQLTTGTITGAEAQILKRMPGFDKAYKEFTDTIKAGGNQKEAAAKLQEAMQKGTERNIELYGRTAAISEEVAKLTGLSNTEDLASAGANLTEDLTKNQKKIQEDLAAAQKSGIDKEADARATLQNANIMAAGAVEDLVSTLNPLKLGFVGLTAAAGAAALALGVMAKRGMLVGSDGSGMMDKIKGMFGGGGAVGGGGGAVGGAGAAVPGGAGAGQIAEGLGKGPAGGGKGFLEKAADGLAAFANPKVVVGAGAFGIAIAAVGAGIAGATWIIGKALPSLAEGLTPFEKLDGDKLKSAGAGIAAIGGGMAVFGAGGAAAGIGGIIGGLSEKLGNSMGIDGPFKKLEDFSKLNIDAKKVKENAEAFMAFNKATAAGGAASAVAGAGGLFGGLIDKLSGKLDLKGPLQQLQEFGSVKVNTENVKNNADAMVMFGDAMSKYKGTNESMWGTLTAGVAGFFKQEPPYVKMQNFAKLDLGPDGAKTVKANAQAFVYFSQALAEFKGTSELKNVADNIVGGIVKMFGGDDVMGKFVKFTKLDVDPDRALKLGQAFAAYSSAMNSMTGGGGAAAGGKGGSSGGGGASAGAPAAVAKAAVPPSPGKGGGGGSGGSDPGAVSAKPSGGGGIMSSIAKAMGFGDEPSTPGEQTAAAPTSTPLPDGAVQMGKEVRVGNEIRKGGTVSWRTNNPGNISYSGIAKKHGAIGTWKKLDGDLQQRTTGIAIMPSLEAGDNLKMEQWRRPKYINKTIDEGVMQWTGTLGPGSGYARDLARAAGSTMDTVIGQLSDAQLKSMVQKQRAWEGFREGEVIKAAKGGIASGPTTGYPATLHGNEMIVPLDPNSLLAELGKKSKEEATQAMANKSGGDEPMKELANINQTMMDMLSSKLDAMISRLETSNDTQSKLLKYTQA